MTIPYSTRPQAIRANRESIPQPRTPSPREPSAPATSSRVRVAKSGCAVRPRPCAGQPADAAEVPRPVAGGDQGDQRRADAEHEGDQQVLQTPPGAVPGD